MVRMIIQWRQRKDKRPQVTYALVTKQYGIVEVAMGFRFFDGDQRICMRIQELLRFVFLEPVIENRIGISEGE